MCSASSSPLGREKKQPIKVKPIACTELCASPSMKADPKECNALSVEHLIDLSRKKEKFIQELLKDFNQEEVSGKDREV